MTLATVMERSREKKVYTVMHKENQNQSHPVIKQFIVSFIKKKKKKKKERLFLVFFFRMVWHYFSEHSCYLHILLLHYFFHMGTDPSTHKLILGL